MVVIQMGNMIIAVFTLIAYFAILFESYMYFHSLADQIEHFL